MTKLVDSNSEITESLNDSKELACGLYLDGDYVFQKVMRKVIKNAKSDGLIPPNSTQENKYYQWVVEMTKHQLLILRIKERAKVKPYSPTGMECLNNYIRHLVRKVSETLADELANYYPPKP
ncbi:hypothetical protein RPZ95_003147 [Vibrio parahaemolyticus]|nr:hypothetical protein [Vibrio parahaemolyticus]HCE2132813.1 hypothetical protein [Vibrio parahaemolyticus]HCG5552361.1 hypothetical protein [Vibrio parahaemolyticus]